jgi:hypothetical protein
MDRFEGGVQSALSDTCEIKGLYLSYEHIASVPRQSKSVRLDGAVHLYGV